MKLSDPDKMAPSAVKQTLSGKTGSSRQTLLYKSVLQN